MDFKITPQSKNVDLMYGKGKQTNKHSAELQRTDPDTKVIGEFSTRGRIFPTYARNGF